MILALEEAKRKLLDLRSVVKELGEQLHIEDAKERAAELERETMVQNFWDDAEKSSKKLQLIKQLKDNIEEYDSLESRLEDALTLCEMAIEVGDEDSVEEAAPRVSDGLGQGMTVVGMDEKKTALTPQIGRRGGEEDVLLLGILALLLGDGGFGLGGDKARGDVLLYLLLLLVCG